MDSVTVKDVILDQKIKDKYDCNMNDFVAAQEITVTITLAEYRQLVMDSATRKEAIDKAEKDSGQGTMRMISLKRRLQS